MESARPQLSLEELHQLRWLLGGVLMLLSIAAVFYLDIDCGAMAAVAAAGVLAALLFPALPARVPLLAHRLAFPVILAFFALDLWHTGQLLPPIVRLDLLLLLYRGISHRARRDDLQIVVLGLFLIVVAGVLTVSLAFAVQILAFTAFALALLMAVAISDSADGGIAPKLARRGSVPSWAQRVRWGRLLRRLREASDWRLLAAGVALFVGVVVVSGLLFLAIPRFQLENSLFLERFISRKARTGFSDSIRFGDVTDIEQDDSIALNVDLSDPSKAVASPYWRMVVLDEYQNGGFRMSAAMRSAAFGRERTEAGVRALQSVGGPGAPTWTVYLESGISRYLPIPGPFEAIRFQEAQTYRYSPDLAIVALREEPASMTAYRIQGMAADTSRIPDPTFAARIARNRSFKGGLPRQLALGIPTEDRPMVDGFVRQIGPPDARGAGDFAQRAIAWLRRNHGYTLSPRIPGGRGDPLVRWTGSREPGHCELFAGALVLVARDAGIPARVVTGFKGGTWNGFSGNYVVRNSDAHAWTEVWDGRAGVWLREDPLGSPADDATVETGAVALAGRIDRSWAARLNSLRVFWYRRIVNFDQQSQADALKAVKDTADSSGRWMRMHVDAAVARLRSWLTAPWGAGRVVRTAAYVAAAGALGWLAASARLGLRGRLRRGGDPVRREAGRWLGRVEGPRPLVEDLQRIRFGPAPTWPRPADVFARARKAASRRR